MFDTPAEERFEAALGLLGIQFPEEYGGAGMTPLDYCICLEEIARVDPAIARRAT